MDGDLLLVIGLGVGLLAVPALISAFSESRPPRAAAIMVMIASALIVLAITERPGGYRIGEIPDVVYAVIGRLMH